MFQRIVLAIVFSLLSLAARADETVLATQKKLAQLGFYKGDADGQVGSQTSAAIRRYQIAENLKVTGELNRQTLQQLGIPGAVAMPAYVAIADIFKGGPYLSAGPEMQVAVVRQAQKNLKLLGYYSGPEDGMPSGGLSSALKVWQKSAGFRQTGRFDENTLKGLDLMSN
ncbi:MAG: peptidoglycan-binding domain-containing protein [Verrucomicrobiae bacterium]